MKNNPALLWLSLNRYSLLLFTGSLASLAFAVLILAGPGWWLLAAVFGILALVLVTNGMKIHQQSGHKHRAVLLLTVRNRKRYSAAGFRKYMVSPCGRVVARTVLSRLGRMDEYREFKKAWPMKFCESPVPTYSVTFHTPTQLGSHTTATSDPEPVVPSRD